MWLNSQPNQNSLQFYLAPLSVPAISEFLLFSNPSIWLSHLPSFVSLFILIFIFYEIARHIYKYLTPACNKTPRLILPLGYLEITNFSLECRAIFWKCSPSILKSNILTNDFHLFCPRIIFFYSISKVLYSAYKRI